MNVQPIIDRIAAQVTEVKAVGGWDDFYRECQSLQFAPQVFVMHASDNFGENQFATTAVQQRVHNTFSVVTAFNAVGDRQEISSAEQLSALINTIRLSLLGWEPAAGFDPITLASGDVAQISNGTIWWQDVFKTSYYLRSI